MIVPDSGDLQKAKVVPGQVLTFMFALSFDMKNPDMENALSQCDHNSHSLITLTYILVYTNIYVSLTYILVYTNIYVNTLS